MWASIASSAALIAGSCHQVGNRTNLPISKGQTLGVRSSKRLLAELTVQVSFSGFLPETPTLQVDMSQSHSRAESRPQGAAL